MDLILERYRHSLKQGAIFVNETDPSEDIRCLFYLEHFIQDSRTDNKGNRRTVSKQLQFVEIDQHGDNLNAGYAPYLDYRPLTEEETAIIKSTLENQDWLRGDLESKATAFAIENLVLKHLNDIKERKQNLVIKTMAAVKERLTKEITYWDHRAEELKAQEAAGKVNAKMNSAKARLRADELTARLQKRLDELQQERQLSPLPPVVIGGALVVPKGLLERAKGHTDEADPGLFARQTSEIEKMAMDAVMAVERKIGFVPRDVSGERCGYDIESSIPETGKLRFIEVKGRVRGADTVTVTKNEILTAVNKPDDFILAVVLLPAGGTSDNSDITDSDYSEVREREGDYQPSNPRVHYIKQPFSREPDFGVTSVNYNLKELLNRAESPDDFRAS